MQVRAVDAAGNVGEIRPLVVGIDATAPVTRATFDPAARTVTLAAADAGSGVELTEYRIAGGTWTTYDGPVQVGSAATTLDYRSTDRLGRVEQPGTLAVPAAGAQLAATVTAAAVAEDSVRLGRKVRVDVVVSAPGRHAHRPGQPRRGHHRARHGHARRRPRRPWRRRPRGSASECTR